MSIINELILASFSEPEMIGVNPHSMLWLLPLVMAIAIVYKATKIPNIKMLNFIKEVIVLFGSIVIFMGLTAVMLFIFAWLLTE